MKRVISLLVAVLISAGAASPSAATTPAAGGACSKVGQAKIVSNKKFTCLKSGKKLVWSKPVKVTASKPKPTPTQQSLASWIKNPPAIPVGQLTTYISFDKENIYLYPWEGEHVALLTQKSDYDPRVMGKVIKAIDLAYTSYVEITGYAPAKAKTINGKLTIAEIPSEKKSCGAGCGYSGATGIQIRSEYFSKLYEGVRDKNEFDQVVFYELGRNFWNAASWTPKLAFKDRDSVVTGFAVLMRFVSMAANQIPIGDFREYTGVQFQKVVTGLAGKYLSEPSNTFSTTFAIEKSPGELGTTDLWASMMMNWSSKYGDLEFYKKFFKAISSLPDSSTTAESLENWSRAISIAIGTDFEKEFFESWRMGQ